MTQIEQLTTVTDEEIEKNSSRIGRISNVYGGLTVSKVGNRFFWGIMNYNDKFGWEEITESLYNELINFESKTFDKQE